MKKILMLVITAFLLALPCAALAATVEIHDFYLCSVGQVRLPYYPDYSSRIGEGLTQDDFIITYACDSPYVTLESDGTVYISENAKLNTNFDLDITYTPKVEGVGETTVFQGRLRTVTPITSMTPERDFHRMSMSGYWLAKVSLRGGYGTQIGGVSVDSDVVTTEYVSGYGDYYYQMKIWPKKPGKATVTVTALNGLQTSIEVEVVGPPTQFKFAKEHFTGYRGETIDIGLDTGNGPYGLEFYNDFNIAVYRDGEYVGNGNSGYVYHRESEFSCRQTGEYYVTFNAYSEGVEQGEFRVSVLDYADCKDISFSTGGLYLDREAKILLLDEYGEEIYRPFTITKGAELVELNYRSITVNKPGLVEITVQNEDGSTLVKFFDVQAIPTQMTLNASELTLGIGETFNLEVIFDQGSDAYTYAIAEEASLAPGLCAVLRMEGDRIIAQAPGTAVITVKARELQASCVVTVPDSDLAVHMVYPEALGVNRSFQLAVVDKTGKEYPARWQAQSGNRFNVTVDGLVTGVYEGKQTLTATLEDGRVLYQTLTVKKIPTTLVHPDLTVHENWTTVGLEGIQTDVGVLYSSEVTVSIEDESIATMGFTFFEFHKPGTTTVTLTAKEGGAQGTFTLTVLTADNSLYLQKNGQMRKDTESISVPAGYYVFLPELVDYYGNPVKVTWRMAEDMPGLGNTTGTGFLFEGNVLACSWAQASCVMEATSADGGKFKLYASGYHMVSNIKFYEESYTVDAGGKVTVNVCKDETSGGMGPVYFTVEDESIAVIQPHAEGSSGADVTGLRPGTTTVTAALINGTTASCTITVLGDAPARVPGDADGDGSVSIMDALAILQYDVGWNIDINVANADANEDGAANILDALLVLQYDVGWDVALK